MKQKISISIDKNTINQIENKVKGGVFRNRSHIIEYAIEEFLRGENGN